MMNFLKEYPVDWCIITKAPGLKCQRCWKYTVLFLPGYEDLCDKCGSIIDNGECDNWKVFHKENEQAISARKEWVELRKNQPTE